MILTDNFMCLQLFQSRENAPELINLVVAAYILMLPCTAAAESYSWSALLSHLPRVGGTVQPVQPRCLYHYLSSSLLLSISQYCALWCVACTTSSACVAVCLSPALFLQPLLHVSTSASASQLLLSHTQSRSCMHCCTTLRWRAALEL